MAIGIEPTHYVEVVKDERSREAMRREIQALENNGTWILETLPPEKKTIGYKSINEIKYNLDGTLECYKACLLILGNRQVECLDYAKTFALVVRW